jgi:hypothetical protein
MDGPAHAAGAEGEAGPEEGSILDFIAGAPAPACAPCAARGGGRARAKAPGWARTSSRADNIAARLDGDVARALEGLTTTTEECAEDVDRAPGAPCSSRRVLKAIAEFVVDVGPAGGLRGAGTEAPAGSLLPTAPTAEAAAVRAAAAALGCDSESCVVAHPALREFVVDRGLAPEGALALELALRFKEGGPRDSLALLSNYDLDGTLRRWARVFPEFFPCPFAMMDFDRNGDLFGEVDLPTVLEGRQEVDLGPGIGVVRRRCTCFGCIVNTDTSSGKGLHWVAVFVDCRGAGPWTVEYFNSAGRPPPRPMVAWCEKTRARLAEYRAGLGGPAAGAGAEAVPVTDVDHQESQTECGLYALYYIRRRLEGTPHTFFADRPIPDDAMTAFRAHVFRRAR